MKKKAPQAPSGERKRNIPVVNAAPEEGLSAQEVSLRQKGGLRNISPKSNTKSERQIIKENTFTFFNLIFIVLAVALAASAVILVYYLISLIPLADRHYAVFFWILSAVLAVCYVVCVFAFRTTYLSTFGYYSVFIWCMVIAMCNDNENAAFYRSVLFASFSVWIIAVIILLFMLNGDSFDFDIIDFSVDSPRKARINSGV